LSNNDNDTAQKDPNRNDNLQYYYSIGGAVVMATSAPLARFLWRRMGEFVEMPKVSVRLDLLVVSWIGAAYIGNHWQNGGGGSGGGDGTCKRHATIASMDSMHRPKSIHHDVKIKNKQNKEQLPTTTAVRNDMAVTPPDTKLEDEYADFASTSSHDAWAEDNDEEDDDVESEEDGEESSSELIETVAPSPIKDNAFLPSPLPLYPKNGGVSCWSQPQDDQFHVRGHTYFHDKVKVPSGQAPFQCRGVDIWLTDNPERHIARHPAVLGRKLHDTDTFLVNFLLPFGNFVAYFEVCPLHQFPDTLRDVWTQFLRGDQQYRDARLKLLTIVVDGTILFFFPLLHFFQPFSHSVHRTCLLHQDLGSSRQQSGRGSPLHYLVRLFHFSTISKNPRVNRRVFMK
jgi:hypothetical protein